jgi:transcription initiation factor TFIIA large subunit
MAVKPEPGYAQVEAGIKQEPGLPAVHPGYNPANGARPTAAQRAALALESQFGQRAAASIHAIHSGMASQHAINPAAQAQQIPRPGQAPQLMNPQQQYRQGVAATIQQQMQQQVPRARPPNGLPAAQYDGSNDAAGDVSGQPGAGSDQPTAMSRAQIDELLHAQLAARAKQMEGGGLMLPLKKATKKRSTATKRQDPDGPAQFDGLDEDIKSEEDDEDAINSDLDDPDEGGEDDEDDDETMGHMMLCMYDKVQRVKNKWCVLIVLLRFLTLP